MCVCVGGGVMVCAIFLLTLLKFNGTTPPVLVQMSTNQKQIWISVFYDKQVSFSKTGNHPKKLPIQIATPFPPPISPTPN